MRLRTVSDQNGIGGSPARCVSTTKSSCSQHHPEEPLVGFTDAPASSTKGFRLLP